MRALSLATLEANPSRPLGPRIRAPFLSQRSRTAQSLLESHDIRAPLFFLSFPILLGWLCRLEHVAGGTAIVRARHVSLDPL